MVRTSVLCAAMLLIFNSVSEAGVVVSEVITFDVSLDPGQEVGTPNTTGFSPTGFATVTLDKTLNLVSVSGSYDGMTTNVIGSHIHGPSGPGANAGIIVPMANTGGTSGTFSVSDFSLTPT